MGFHFAKYDVKELEECGNEFTRDFTSCALSGNPEWTCGVFEWFRKTAPEDMRVYPAANDSKKGEFIVDLCHTTYPKQEDADGGWPSTVWYERAEKVDCLMKLALESEWGKWAYADQSLVMVLDDACKLAVLRAQVKVMIFSSHWDDRLDRVPVALKNLRTSHRDTHPWLWIDVPNEPTRTLGTPRGIRHGILID